MNLVELRIRDKVQNKRISLKFKIIMVAVFFVSLLKNVPIQAIDLQIHGFADIVGTQTNTDFTLNDLGNHADQLGFDPESRLGLNLSSAVADGYIFAAQILARGGDKGAYKLLADWIFVTYKPSDRVMIRAGRQINPAFLFSEQVDVGFTYLWTRLPYELYGNYPIKSFNGISMAYIIPIGNYTFKTEILGGSSDIDIEKPNYSVESRADNMRGIQLTLNSDQTEFRMAYIANNSEATITGAGLVDFGTIQLYSVGANINWNKFILFIEGSRMDGNAASIRSVTSAYMSLGYKFESNFTSYITYAMANDYNGTIFTNPTISPAVPTTTKDAQHSLIVGVNYKPNPSVVLKGEYMRSELEFKDSTKDFGANTFTATMDIIF